MSSDDYKFMQILDARTSINQRVNLIAVVTETSLPIHSQGTDFHCSAKIVDQSWPSAGINVNFFAETIDNLPFVHSVGDIILVSQVLMKIRGQEVYALYNKKYSSFAMFEGRHSSSNEFLPYQVSPKYKAREQDKRLVMGLRKWLVNHKIEGLSDVLLLREIKEHDRFNLLCRILHVCEIKKDEWMIFVWDGTDTPPASIEAKLADEMESPLPLQLEPFPLSRDVLCTFPRVGTVLRMIVDQGKGKIGINFIHANRWIKFVNIRCESHAGLWCGVLLPFSKFCYLPDDDNLIKERKRSYKERVRSHLCRMPFTCFPWPSDITETDHPDKSFVTLMRVLTYPEVTYTYKCVVRVVAISPWAAEAFRSPEGTYMVRLTIEDPTARVHAYVCGEDGTKFLGDDYSVDVLTRKRNLLLGIGEGAGGKSVNHISRNPPWIQCCLKSFYTDKADIWGSRMYGVYHTTLVC